MFSPSPIESITVGGDSFYLKRDDLLHIDFSGNKARKFYHFLHKDFPHIQKIVSYGSAQSNAMYSLSVLAKLRGWKFDYYVSHIADYLLSNPHGNYRGALDNGMNIIVGEIPQEYPKDVLVIEEGGRQKESLYGIEILAREIIDWQKENSIKNLNIFLPSGTGTTALYLQKSLIDTDMKVYTTPCVGDSAYLTKQFEELEINQIYHPQILTLDKKHHFGKLYRQNYEIWLKLQQETKVEFDLLYDPLGWRVLLHHINIFTSPILYIHQGGVLGNESMLPRYERKYQIP